VFRADNAICDRWAGGYQSVDRARHGSRARENIFVFVIITEEERDG